MNTNISTKKSTITVFIHLCCLRKYIKYIFLVTHNACRVFLFEKGKQYVANVFNLTNYHLHFLNLNLALIIVMKKNLCTLNPSCVFYLLVLVNRDQSFMQYKGAKKIEYPSKLMSYYTCFWIKYVIYLITKRLKKIDEKTAFLGNALPK